MASPLLHLSETRLSYGGTPLLDGAELSVSAGDKVCLVGRNGSGKSTLLKIAAGLVEADHTERKVSGEATVRYLAQEPDLSVHADVRSYVTSALGPHDPPHRAVQLIEKLGLTGDEPTAHLSGGEARRAALAAVLAPEPDVLLLDEPTNHLDLPAIEWLEQELRRSRSAVVLISHDRRFLENLSTATVWLDRGQTKRLEKGFQAFEAWRDELLDQEERDQHKLERKIAREAHWLRYGVTARRKRNQRRLRDLQGLRTEKREHRKVQGNVKLEASEGAATSGKIVIEAKGLTRAFSDAPVVDGFSLRVQRGDRVGLVGPNGAGKTTLLNMLTGGLAPDDGTVRLGANLQMAYLDQKRADLAPETTLKDALTGGSGDTVSIHGQSRHVIGYMKDFLFAPEQAGLPLNRLSGGERGRLMLARALAQPSNLLVLDEPTNDLDLETLDLLQEMLADYPGTVLLVSHDRDFLDRVATSTVAFEGRGRWQEYAGGYSDMLTQRSEAEEVAPPKIASKSKPSKTRENAEASSKAKTGGDKLSFTDKHLLKTLPEKIAALEKQITALRIEFEDPDLYARNRSRFDEVAAVLKACEIELSEAEDQWLELEMKREEMAG